MVTFFLFLFFCLVVAVIVGITQSENKTKKEVEIVKESYNWMYELDKQKFVVEFSSHKRILEDSVVLIQTTNNLDTLSGRYSEVLTHYYWIQAKKNAGMPVVFKEEPCGFLSSLNRATNFHIARIAQFNYEKAQDEITKLKTKKAKDSRYAAVLELVERCKLELKQHENKMEATSELDNIHDMVESAYSDSQYTN